MSFPPVTALLPGDVRDAAAPPPSGDRIPFRRRPTEHQIAELVLHTGARVNRFEEKAAFATLPGLSDRADAGRWRPPTR